MLEHPKKIKTEPASSPSEFDLTNIKHAIFQGELGLSGEVAQTLIGRD